MCVRTFVILHLSNNRSNSLRVGNFLRHHEPMSFEHRENESDRNFDRHSHLGDVLSGGRPYHSRRLQFVEPIPEVASKMGAFFAVQRAHTISCKTRL